MNLINFYVETYIFVQEFKSLTCLPLVRKAAEGIITIFLNSSEKGK